MPISPFPYSQLDFSQCIRGAYDEAAGRLRVETAATIVDGAVEVAIDASTDNIQIRDPFNGNNLHINADGSLNVDISGSAPSTVKIEDSAGNPLTSTAGALNVNTTGSVTVSGSVTASIAGLNSFQTSQYTVGLAVVQLANPPLAGRSSLSIRMDKSNSGAIYIGNSNAVTTSTGYPLFAGDTLGMDLTDSKTIFAIADTATQHLAILEIS